MYYHVLLTESMVAADPVLRQDDYHYTSVEEEFDRSMERSMKKSTKGADASVQ